MISKCERSQALLTHLEHVLANANFETLVERIFLMNGCVGWVATGMMAFGLRRKPVGERVLFAMCIYPFFRFYRALSENGVVIFSSPLLVVLVVSQVVSSGANGSAHLWLRNRAVAIPDYQSALYYDLAAVVCQGCLAGACEMWCVSLVFWYI